MSTIEAPVARIREFNRFYTRLIGVLDEHHLDGPLGIAEARILYEISGQPGMTAADLCRTLEMDAGYVSRILRALKKRGLLARKRSESDARRTHLNLTRSGREAFAEIDARTRLRMEELLQPLAPPQRDRLLRSLREVQTLLGGGNAEEAAVRIRTHQPGDLGWIVHRHAVLYEQEYGWGIDFERVVAEIAAQFLGRFDPQSDGCWIAERGGERLGSIALAREEGDAARLRLFLVEPDARGLGIGWRLIDACHAFARQAGYRRIILWTQSNLLAARHMYRKAGYHIISELPHNSFGQNLIAETWALEL
ncbi:MAG: bifunctional helix-turn-helix transcriptional regulator/GNAT family N-acetyltransferase [Bryobacteraceae bacterium]|nr:bifunctional helix-turn-helix transcriptional regulator/GNAT family N-acetyltransferase [Bryobacteraceae bacterium]